MSIYVVLHHGQVEKAFKRKEDALKYVFDDENVGDMEISNVGPETGGDWGIESCNLE